MNREIRRARLIVNGRRPLSRRLADRFHRLALRREIELEIVHTSLANGVADTVDLGKAAARDSLDLILVAGGDGTVSEVVSGIEHARYESTPGLPFTSLETLGCEENLDRRVEGLRAYLTSPDLADAPALGVLPYGSANVLAMNLGLSRGIEKAFWEILTEGQHTTDRLKIGWILVNGRVPGESTWLTQPFLIAAGAGGTVEELMHHFNRPGQRRGMIGYLRSAWHVLWHFDPAPIDLDLHSAQGGSTERIRNRRANLVLFNLRRRMLAGRAFMPRADSPYLHAILGWARPGPPRVLDLLRMIVRVGLGRIVRGNRRTDYHEIERADFSFQIDRLVIGYDGEVRTVETGGPPIQGIVLPAPSHLPILRSTTERNFLRYVWSFVRPVHEEIHPGLGETPTLHRFVIPDPEAPEEDEDPTA